MNPPQRDHTVMQVIRSKDQLQTPNSPILLLLPGVSSSTGRVFDFHNHWFQCLKNFTISKIKERPNFN
jgi:hypothetical protein